MKILFLLTAIISLLLGILGYIEKIFSLQYSAILRWGLLVLFILSWGGMRVLEVIKEKRAAEVFYEKEKVEVFPHSSDSRQKMKFFTDEHGNKCVILYLERFPIPKSVKLFEGGYEAPPITLGFNGKEVSFRFSAYANFEEYLRDGPMYQIRYFPK